MTEPFRLTLTPAQSRALSTAIAEAQSAIRRTGAGAIIHLGQVTWRKSRSKASPYTARLTLRVIDRDTFGRLDAALRASPSE
jgi:hypothetical protein